MFGANVNDQCVILDFDNYLYLKKTKMAFLSGRIDFLDPKQLILDIRIISLCHV